jgi:hypothetical protein
MMPTAFSHAPPFRPSRSMPDATEPSTHAAPKHSRTSYGHATVHLVSVLSPLVIGELIKDPEKRWRWIRIASVATALAGEAMWRHHAAKERDRNEGRSR